MNDPHYLQRFVDAQRRVIDAARAELQAGEKRGHWMWFVFPQLKGLGHSSLAHEFGISSLVEAAAYLEHPVLGPRLRDCTRLVNLRAGRSVEQIFGYPDNLKFRSSMTLFARATSENREFVDALNQYFNGEYDRLTLELLGTGVLPNEPSR